jgi:hypothetical protein
MGPVQPRPHQTLPCHASHANLHAIPQPTPLHPRRVLQRIRDLTWRLMRYDDPGQPLAATDLDLLEGRPPPTGAPPAAVRSAAWPVWETAMNRGVKAPADTVRQLMPSSDGGSVVLGQGPVLAQRICLPHPWLRGVSE